MKSLISFSFLLSIFILFSSLNGSENNDDISSYEVDLKTSEVEFFWKDSLGAPYSSLGNLKEHVEAKGKQLVFAMNGGMYKKDQSPQGLYIENGKLISPIDTIQNAFGNFYMQPNGVFYITESNTAQVCVSDSFPNSNRIKHATQSGPMLLINGKYHPKFMKGSKNLNIRNGVGVLPNGNILFAISIVPVNFYDFASFFKNQGCLNALYLDGFVSKAYHPQKGLNDLGGSFGVLIAETTH